MKIRSIISVSVVFIILLSCDDAKDASVNMMMAMPDNGVPAMPSIEDMELAMEEPDQMMITSATPSEACLAWTM